MWRVAYDPGSELLSMQLRGHVGPSEMRELARAHAEALEATGGQPFGVLLDLRGLTPLEDEAVDVLFEMKRIAAALPGFRAMVVLVDSATVGMQQRRTRIEGPTREVLTMDAAEATRLLAS